MCVRVCVNVCVSKWDGGGGIERYFDSILSELFAFLIIKVERNRWDSFSQLWDHNSEIKVCLLNEQDF